MPSSSSGEGDRAAAARYLAAAYVCRESERPCLRCAACRKVLEDIHPDVRWIADTERRELPVETLRELRRDVYIRPNEGERKVYIFSDCGQLNERDQNVLLKIVEEGPPYAAFLFCTETSAALLETIRSRCVEWKLRGSGEVALSGRALELCRVLAGGSAFEAAAHLAKLESRRLPRGAAAGAARTGLVRHRTGHEARRAAPGGGELCRGGARHAQSPRPEAPCAAGAAAAPLCGRMPLQRRRGACARRPRGLLRTDFSTRKIKRSDSL